jgi:hypothetical protein
MHGSVLHEIADGQHVEIFWSHSEDDGFLITGVYAGSLELYNSQIMSQWAMKSCEKAADQDAEQAFRIGRRVAA